MGKKVLIVTYYWFPQSGTGIYRISKLVKYLKRAGWEPVILTASKSLSSYKEKQIDDEYKDLKVYQTKIIEPTNLFAKKDGNSQVNFNSAYVVAKNKSLKQKFLVWIRSNLFIPDAKIFWKFFAVKKGKEVIKIEKPDIILSTSPPPTTHLIARKLAKWSKIKWVADFRDPWTNIYYYENLNINPISRKINKRLEQKVLKSADQIVTVSDNFFTGIDIGEKMLRIENGFDPDDIPSEKNYSQKDSNKFIIRYIGTLKQNQFFKNFLLVLRELGQNEEYKNKIEFEIIGYIDPQIKQFIKETEINIDFKYTNYLPHKDAVAKMAESNMLILAIGKEKANMAGISTKIFEYLMVGKPILAFGHKNGAADKIITKTNGGKLFSYDDYEDVKKFIVGHIEDRNNTKGSYNPDVSAINYYNFENITKRYIERLESCLNK